MPNVLKSHAVAAKLGISQRQVRIMNSKGELPTPIKISKTDGWIEHEIDAFIEKKMAERNAAVDGGAE